MRFIRVALGEEACPVHEDQGVQVAVPDTVATQRSTTSTEPGARTSLRPFTHAWIPCAGWRQGSRPSGRGNGRPGNNDARLELPDVLNSPRVLSYASRSRTTGRHRTASP